MGCISTNSLDRKVPEFILGEVPFSLSENEGKVYQGLMNTFFNKNYLYVKATSSIENIDTDNIYSLVNITFSSLNDYPGYDYSYGYSDKKFIFTFENIQNGDRIIIEKEFDSSNGPYESYFRSINLSDEERSHIRLGGIVLPINNYDLVIEKGIFYTGFYFIDEFEKNISIWLENSQKINDEQRALLSYGGTNYMEFTYREAFGNAEKYYNIQQGTILYISERSLPKIYGGAKENIYIFEWEIIGYSYEPHTIIQFVVDDNLNLIKYKETLLVPNANGPDQRINIYNIIGPFIIKRIGSMNITLNNGRMVARPLFELLQFVDYDPRNPNYK
jgi:hypothetical protein